MFEASNSAETDRRTKELIGLRNKLDSLIRNTQRTFLEFGSSLSSEEKQAGSRTLDDAEAAAKSQNFDDIQRVVKSVEKLGAQLTKVMLNPSANSSEN